MCFWIIIIEVNDLEIGSIWFEQKYRNRHTLIYHAELHIWLLNSWYRNCTYRTKGSWPMWTHSLTFDGSECFPVQIQYVFVVLDGKLCCLGIAAPCGRRGVCLDLCLLAMVGSPPIFGIQYCCIVTTSKPSELKAQNLIARISLTAPF